MSDQAFMVREKLASLQTMLTDNLPNISTVLRDIHSTLKKDPDVVTILTDEEVAILVNGLDKQTQANLAGSVAKSKTPKAKLKETTLEDL